MRFGARTFGWLLVLLGLVYLLDKFGALRDLGLSFTPGIVWPLLVTFIGLVGTARVRYGKVPWFSIFLMVFGVILLLRNAHLVPVLLNVGAWSLFWSLAVIVVGLALVLPKRSRWPKVKVHMKKDTTHSVSVDELAHTWRDWKRHKHSSSRWIGDISMGKQPWTLKDTDLWNAIGDIRVNLATAHVEDGTYRIGVGGWIGDVRILVPQSLAVTVNASVSIGDLTVFDDIQSGTGRRVQYVDAGFDEASRRVVIDIDLKIGDVQIIRV